MSKPVNFTIREADGRFVVNVPALYSGTGKRQRLKFKTRIEAEAERKRRMQNKKKHGTSILALPADLSADAKKARAILDGAGDVTLVEAAKFYMAAKEERERSKPFADLMDEFTGTLEARNRSAAYIRDVRYAKTRMEPVIGKALVSEITTKQLREAFLAAKLTPTGQKSMKRNLRAAFSYAVAHGYAATNPAKGMLTDDADDREIATLTPTEAKALYAAASDDVKPYVVLATWCGIRPEEVKRLDWADVNWGREWVEVRRSTSKTKRRRFVEMSENVLAMLEPYKGMTGKVVACSPNAWKLEFKAARVAAGVFDGWQEDTLRHSFASYHVALHNDLDGLARQMGHSGTGTAYQHYLDAVGLKEAKEFWSVGVPKKRKTKKKEAAA